jgi:hypothetical protein
MRILFGMGTGAADDGYGGVCHDGISYVGIG